MMRRHIPHDRLLDEVRDLRPDDAAWPETAEGRSALTRALVMNPRDVWARPRRMHGRTSKIAAGSIIAVIAGAGSVAAVNVYIADSPTQAGCYEALSAQANTIEASADLVQRVGAVEACRQTWANVQQDVDTTNLVVCVNSAGGRGVFPAGRGVTATAACGQIGWQPDDAS